VRRSLLYAADTMNGKQLRQARRRLNLTQAQLGDAIGLHKNTIARMERDELEIVRTTELSVRYLLLVEKPNDERKH
jgi:DNA-binding XRE family transcriptional regulator